MVDLKAVVFEKEAPRARKRRAEARAMPRDMRLRMGGSGRALRSVDRSLGSSRNAGLEERMEKDREAMEREQPSEEDLQARLKAKEMMYEKLVRGEEVGSDEETYMVDFFAKKHRRAHQARRGNFDWSSSGSGSGSGSSDEDGEGGGGGGMNRREMSAEQRRERKRKEWEREVQRMEEEELDRKERRAALQAVKKDTEEARSSIQQARARRRRQAALRMQKLREKQGAAAQFMASSSAV